MFVAGTFSRRLLAVGAARVGTHAPYPLVPQRSFGVKDWLQDKKNKRVEKTATENFNKFVEDMSKSPQYTMQMHMDISKKNAESSGITGWRSYIPGRSMAMGQSAEAEELFKKQLTIMENMTPAERLNVTLIGKDEKLRIAQKSICQVVDVNEVIKQYEQLATMHSWLYERKKKGLTMPTSQQEMMTMMQQSRPSVTRKQKAMSKPRRR
eukprot:g67372.t1